MLRPICNEHWRHQRDIRQVRAATERIVEHGDIAGRELERIHRRPHRHGHGAEMHRHVVAHSDDLAACVEHRAGIIAPLFDVGRERGAAQRRAHFFGDGMKQILENFDLDGIAHQ